MSTQKSSRKPKFERTELDTPLLITERDLDIFEALLRYRFMSSDHLAFLIKGSENKIRRRLQLLFHGGYVDRPKVQITVYQPTLNEAFVYALGRQGAKALVDYDRRPQVRLDWTNRNKTITRPFLKHALATAEVMIAFQHYADSGFLPEEHFQQEAQKISSEKSRGVILGKSQSPIKDEKNGNASHTKGEQGLNSKTDKHKSAGNVSWRVSVNQADKDHQGVAPDYMFGLKGQDGKTSYFFLEADRGTMPVVRTAIRQTSLLEKVRGYLASQKQQIPQSLFGIHSFRVLFVLPSKERLENLLLAIQEETGGVGARLFLLTTYEDIKNQNPYAVVLINGRREEVVLEKEWLS